MSNDCILCKLRNEELEVTKIFEDDTLSVIMDIQPVNSGHMLIFPRFKNDGFGLKFSENYTSLPSREEINEKAQKIMNSLSGLF